jgi:serine protease Do
MARSAKWVVGALALSVGVVFGSYFAGRVLFGQNAPIVTAVPKELNSYRDVVKKVLPAVVSIESKAKAVKTRMPKRNGNPQLPQGVPEEFRQFFEGMDEQQPDAERQPVQGFGSGFLIDPKGVILTNHHVVAGADSVEVTLQDGRKFSSKEIKSDPKSDLAVVRIEPKGALPYLEMGDSDQMEIGDRVLAVGAPFGLTGSVTSGIVSAKGRNGLSMNMYEDFLQTDAAINPGNSGGPLVNLEGKVVGINSAIKTRSGGFQGVGLAISSNMAKTVAQQLQKDGTVKRGYLGVQIKDLTDHEVAERLGLKGDQTGVLVSSVFDKSPAGKAGVQAGDVITSLGGKPVKDGRELQRVVAGLPLGKPVDMMVLRDGKEQKMSVTIEAQPEDFGVARVAVPSAPRPEKNATSLDSIGIEVADLTAEMAEKLGTKNHTGAVILGVEGDSLAEVGGLRKGMLITKVDKVPVKSAVEVRDAVEKGSLEKGILFQTYSAQGGTGYVLLKKEKEPARK